MSVNNIGSEKEQKLAQKSAIGKESTVDKAAKQAIGTTPGMAATGTEGCSQTAVKGGGGSQKAEKKAKEIGEEKKQPPSPSPPSTATPAVPAAAIISTITKQRPSVHCLLCQTKLELHPSLITQGGEIGPIGNDPDATSPTGIVEIDANVESLLADMKLKPEDEDVGPSTSSLVASQLHGGNMNLLELIGKSNSPLDVPMCQNCATSMTGELQQQLAGLEAECRQYKQSLDQLLRQRADSPFDQDMARRKLETLKAEERDLQEQLAFLAEEEQTLSHELVAKMEERRRISERDEQLYRKLRDNHRTLIEQTDEQRSLKLQIRHAEEQVKRLARTNVMDMCFHIWVDGEFGTISGFRLGRLRHEPVEWNEINAALGQMAFLLKVISERLNMEFVGYELVPCANCSFIRDKKHQQQQQSSNGGNGRVEELPLYGNGGWRPFGQSALDKALVAFMDCFIQVEQRLKQYFPSGTQLLPYRMLKDKIVDKDSQYLVKMQLNSEERWTKAMKCLLLNLKRVIGILTTLPALTAQQQQPSPRSMGGTTTKSASSSPLLSPSKGAGAEKLK